jgi:hypothetical protein
MSRSSRSYKEGRFAIVTDVGSGIAMDALDRQTSEADAYGEIVWS